MPSCCDATPPVRVEVVDNGDGTVTVLDDGVALVWLKEASCIGPLPWLDASSWAASLATGACGLRDGSSPGDWQLPTHTELLSLAMDLASPAYRAAGSPLAGIAPGEYWSSYSPCHGLAGAVDVGRGDYFTESMDLALGVWPVRR